MADNARKIQNRLQNMFGIAVQSGGKQVSAEPMVVPAKKPARDNKDVKPKALKLPSDAQKVWNWWLSETHDKMSNFEDRKTRYNDVDYMVLNSGIMSMALELYADESVQADSQSSTITVTAGKKEVQKDIEALLNEWGIDQPTVRDIAYELAGYGDSFTVNSMSFDQAKLGITDVTKVDPREIKERLEFRLSDARKAVEKKSGSLVKKLRKKAISDIVNKLAAKDGDVSEIYKPYLFGYIMSTDETLPPWNVTHFRLETSKSELYPYGKSLFLNAIANFRQYQGAKNLQALLRGMNFPREHYTVKVDPDASEMEAWEAVQEAKTEYHNIGNSEETKGKEAFSAGSQVWTPEGLINFNLLSPNIRMNEIHDVELLRDELIMSSRVPKGYLIVDKGSFGTSGQALLQQFKPFARSVFTIQSAILKGIAQMIRIHFLITGKHGAEMTDFTLGMQFPVTEEAQDRIRTKNDTLRLAGDVINQIKQAFGMRDGLPPEVVKQVFTNLSFLDAEDVDRWVDATADQEGLYEEGKRVKETANFYEQFIEKYPNAIFKERLTESKQGELLEKANKYLCQEAFIKVLNEQSVAEATLNGRHFINNSKSISTHDKAALTEILKTIGSKKLEG